MMTEIKKYTRKEFRAGKMSDTVPERTSYYKRPPKSSTTRIDSPINTDIQSATNDNISEKQILPTHEHDYEINEIKRDLKIFITNNENKFFSPIFKKNKSLPLQKSKTRSEKRRRLRTIGGKGYNDELLKIYDDNDIDKFCEFFTNFKINNQSFNYPSFNLFVSNVLHTMANSSNLDNFSAMIPFDNHVNTIYKKFENNIMSSPSPQLSMQSGIPQTFYDILIKFVKFCFTNNQGIPIREDYRLRFNTFQYNPTSLKYDIIRNTFRFDYPCYDYNEDLVKNYELDFIKNKEAHQKLIDDHYTYISSLSFKYKRVITDYTNRGFHLYLCYLRDTTPDKSKFIDDFKTKINDTKISIGNCFFFQIKEVLKKDGYGKYGYTHQTPDLLFNYNLLTNQGDIYDEPSYIKYISNEHWIKIFKLYEETLNIIIINAPPVRKEIYCFRGSAKDYMFSNTTINLNGKDYDAYKTDSFSSFTFDFEQAKNYYDRRVGTDDPNDKADPIIYKATILPWSSVLFVGYLSKYPYELEIITPQNQIFAAEILAYDKDKPIYSQQQYNGRNLGAEICYKKTIPYKTTELLITPLHPDDKSQYLLTESRILNSDDEISPGINLTSQQTTGPKVYTSAYTTSLITSIYSSGIKPDNMMVDDD